MKKIELSVKRKLKQQAHHLKPIIIIGAQGLTEAVQLEIETALTAHELIKIKINAENKEEREAMIREICQARESELIQTVGHVICIYREKDK